MYMTIILDKKAATTQHIIFLTMDSEEHIQHHCKASEMAIQVVHSMALCSLSRPVLIQAGNQCFNSSLC